MEVEVVRAQPTPPAWLTFKKYVPVVEIAAPAMLDEVVPNEPLSSSASIVVVPSLASSVSSEFALLLLEVPLVIVAA